MKIFELGKVKIGLSDKTDGNMKVFDEVKMAEVTENRAKMLSGLDLTLETTDFVKISYDVDDYCQFFVADETDGLARDRGARRCDGLLTTEVGLGLFLPLADCLGLVLYDTASGVMMMVHCGRQTVVQEGAFKAVGFMRMTNGTKSSDVVAWTSPAAGKENYPLYDLDGMSLSEAVVKQLTMAGVLEENIQRSDVDTTTSNEYWSHSQGDKEERFAIAAVMKEDEERLR